MRTISGSVTRKSAESLAFARSSSAVDLATAKPRTHNHSSIHDLQTRHPALGMLRLEYLHKMLLYTLLCLMAKALTANPCFGFAMQYCQLRMPNGLLVFLKAFRWRKTTEALFLSFI